MSNESIHRWAHYSTGKLEEFRKQVVQQDGDALPGLREEIQIALERRRAPESSEANQSC